MFVNLHVGVVALWVKFHTDIVETHRYWQISHFYSSPSSKSGGCTTIVPRTSGGNDQKTDYRLQLALTDRLWLQRGCVSVHCRLLLRLTPGEMVRSMNGTLMDRSPKEHDPAPFPRCWNVHLAQQSCFSMYCIGFVSRTKTSERIVAVEISWVSRYMWSGWNDGNAAVIFVQTKFYSLPAR